MGKAPRREIKGRNRSESPEDQRALRLGESPEAGERALGLGA